MALSRLHHGVLLLVAIAVPVVAGGQSHGKAPKGTMLIRAEDLAWREAPASLLKGARIALVEGDPAKEGPFVARFRFPDGYRVLPHWHPKRERVTVLSGTLYVGMGEKFERDKGMAMPAGTFGSWPEKMAHFGWASGETVIQIHGIGPWEIHYIDPKDDPRNNKDKSKSPDSR